MSSPPRTRVLLVDDSAVVRKLLGDALRRHDDIEVIGGAADPYIARDMILQHKPDVITLDIEMPRMDGLSFLRKLMEHHPIPAIVVSSLTQQGSVASVEALRIGAIDVIGKPGGPHAVGEVADRVADRIRALRTGSPIKLGRLMPDAPAADQAAARSAGRLRGLIAIGASTGGTQAIETVLTRMPADVPPIVIVQHMPAGFTKAFAARLNGVCRMRVVEAAGNEPLERGVAYVAPGGHHLTVDRVGLRLLTRLDQNEPIHYQRPAVDALFTSASRLRGLPIVAMLLTGMGADGAEGMLALRHAGAETIAEAEESCVVFGMPKEAIARGGAGHVASLLAIPHLVVDCLARLNRASRASGRMATTTDIGSIVSTGPGARLVVGIAELAVSQTPHDVIVTHALGSCIAVCVWDPVVRVAGLLHFLLPEAKLNMDRARKQPATFADSGIALLFQTAYTRGVDKKRCVVRLIGGAEVAGLQGVAALNVGKRNLLIARQILWQNGVLVSGESTGGTIPRTVTLRASDGVVDVRTGRDMVATL